MNIRDSVVFVTGANRGLGLAFAEENIKRGARKVYAGVQTPTGRDTPGAIEVKLDVTDPASIAAAAARCGDTTLLINNAGIARLNASSLDPLVADLSREIFETNYYGVIRVCQIFAPVIAGNGGGAVINVLSDAVWLTRPPLAAYSASKGALWSFTNALRSDLRGQNILVQGLHVGFMDTDMTKGLEIEKTSPRLVVEAALGGLETDREEVLADNSTREVKRSLSSGRPIYLDPPEIS